MYEFPDVPDAQHESFNVADQTGHPDSVNQYGTEVMLAVLRLRIMGQSYESIDTLVFGQPAGTGNASWLAARDLHSLIDAGLLPPRAEDS